LPFLEGAGLLRRDRPVRGGLYHDFPSRPPSGSVRGQRGVTGVRRAFGGQRGHAGAGGASVGMREQEGSAGYVWHAGGCLTDFFELKSAIAPDGPDRPVSRATGKAEIPGRQGIPGRSGRQGSPQTTARTDRAVTCGGPPPDESATLPGGTRAAGHQDRLKIIAPDRLQPPPGPEVDGSAGRQPPAAPDDFTVGENAPRTRRNPRPAQIKRLTGTAF
jgi:hypothetical protein